ncbi:MAG: hypothetical protein EBE86_026850 [Hormoscilla sp. GUM202]|nr:hypothetical protein [Hormoscilla sp. GUM202]
MDTIQKIAIESLRDVSVEEFWRRLQQQGPIAVELTDGHQVIVQAKLELPPLPILEGYVPSGWKDAIYSEHPETGFLR